MDYLGNNDMSYTAFVIVAVEPMRMTMAMIMECHVPVTCILPLRMTVTVLRGVCMHSDDVHPAAILFAEHFHVRIGGRENPSLQPGIQTRPDPIRFFFQSNLPLFPLVILSSNEIDEERQKRRHHREESREGEFRPGKFRQARIGESFRSIGKHMNKRRRKNHAGSKRLSRYKEIAIRFEKPAMSAE